jgi:hypothetical protein
MAAINKLSIRGVRAFSPDDQEQVSGLHPIVVDCSCWMFLRVSSTALVARRAYVLYLVYSLSHVSFLWYMFSLSVDPPSEQVVEFYFPCTIIVGQNGCGKYV